MDEMNAVRLQFNQVAMKMKSCLARISIPDQMSQFILSNMREHLAKASDFSMCLAESPATIETNHLNDIQSEDLDAMRANVTELDSKYDGCVHILSQNYDHSTFISNNLATSQVFIDDANQAQARGIKEAKAQAMLKLEYIEIDLQVLVTSLQKVTNWATAEDHVIAHGMRMREKWRNQHTDLQKKIIEVLSIITLNDLNECKSMGSETRSKIHNFGSFLEQKIQEIELADTVQGLYTDRSTKACPVKLPTYAGSPRRTSSCSRRSFPRLPKTT